MNASNIKKKSVVGAAAGNVTVTGIKLGDKLISVESIDIALAEGTPNTRTWSATDLTSQFSVTADDTINNTAGTSSANKLLQVIWEAEGGGRALGTFGTTRTGRSNF